MIYMLPPVLPTPAVEKTDELLKVKGPDRWGVVNRRGGIVNCWADC